MPLHVGITVYSIELVNYEHCDNHHPQITWFECTTSTYSWYDFWNLIDSAGLNPEIDIFICAHMSSYLTFTAHRYVVISSSLLNFRKIVVKRELNIFSISSVTFHHHVTYCGWHEQQGLAWKLEYYKWFIGLINRLKLSTSFPPPLARRTNTATVQTFSASHYVMLQGRKTSIWAPWDSWWLTNSLPPSVWLLNNRLWKEGKDGWGRLQHE